MYLFSSAYLYNIIMGCATGGLVMIMIIDHFYSATLSTNTQRRFPLQHGYCIGVSRRRAQATVSKGLAQGAVHKVRHAIFGQILPPPSVTLRHTSRDPPKVRHTSRTPHF